MERRQIPPKKKLGGPNWHRLAASKKPRKTKCAGKWTTQICRNFQTKARANFKIYECPGKQQYPRENLADDTLGSRRNGWIAQLIFPILWFLRQMYPGWLKGKEMSRNVNGFNISRFIHEKKSNVTYPVRFSETAQVPFTPGFSSFRLWPCISVVIREVPTFSDAFSFKVGALCGFLIESFDSTSEVPSAIKTALSRSTPKVTISTRRVDAVPLGTKASLQARQSV